MKIQNCPRLFPLFLFMAGCTAIPENKPVGHYPEATWKIGDQSLSRKIGVQTTFEEGSNAIHVRRANDISKQLVEQLRASQSTDSHRQCFEIVESLVAPAPGSCDLLIRLCCKAPRYTNEKNNGLLLIGWPATFSLFGAPLGLAVLSCRGVIKDHYSFDWAVSVLGGARLDQILYEQAIPSIEAVVSATGWGTPQETIIKSCEYADEHAVASAIEIINGRDMNALLAARPARAEAVVERAVAAEEYKLTANVKWKRENTYLLAIGAGAFSDPAIRPLAFSSSDAEKIAAFFKAAGVEESHISVLSGEKATRSDVMVKLSEMCQKMDEGALGVFYYSGHGAPIISYNQSSTQAEVKDAVLVPYDARDAAMADTGITLATLRQKLSETDRDWLVILDSCFSGKAGRSIMPSGVKGMVVMPKNLTQIKGGRVCWMLATSGNNYANEHKARKGGLFTCYFLDALNGDPCADSNGDGELSVKEVFDWTSEKVRKWSQSQGMFQQPELEAPETEMSMSLIKCTKP